MCKVQFRMPLLLSTHDFARCCRVCLKKMPNLQSLYGSSLDYMLSSLISVKVSADDGCPQQMCMQCINRLSAAFTFKQTAQKSQDIIREIIVTEIQSADKNIEITPSNNKIASQQEDNLSPPVIEEPDMFENSVNCNEVEIVSEVSPREDTLSVDKTADLKTCLDCSLQTDNVTKLERPRVPAPRPAPPPAPGRGAGSPYLCSFCGNSYKWRTSLARHVRLHAAGAAGAARVCPVCGRACVSGDALRAHLVTHSRERAHRCGACGRRYSQRAALRRHARARHPPRPGAVTSAPAAAAAAAAGGRGVTSSPVAGGGSDVTDDVAGLNGRRSYVCDVLS